MTTFSVLAGPTKLARMRFEASVQRRAAALSPEARIALAGMLDDLATLALTNAEESLRRSKWMMHAYWRVVTVYARHFRRLTRSA